MKFWNPIKAYMERKQEKSEQIWDATWELEQRLDNPKQASLLALSLLKFRKNHPNEDYEVVTGTEDELKKKGYGEYGQYTHIGQKFVSPGLPSEKIWEIQRDRRRFNPGLDESLSQYEDFVESYTLARDKYEPLYGVIVPKTEEPSMPKMINYGTKDDEPFDYR